MEEEKTPVTSPNTLRETEPAKDYPNTLFAIFLGVFFCLLFRASIASIRQFAGDIIPGIRSSENPTIFIAYYAIYVLWLAFGFWSVILALKSSRSAVFCLKLSIPYHFANFLFSTHSNTYTFFPGNKAVYFVAGIIAFYILFFIYLFASKHLKADFPPRQRRIGIPGTTGLLLYAALIALPVQSIAADFYALKKARKTDIAKITLNPGELTDGKIIFLPKSNWILDSATVLDENRDAFCFHTPNGHANIRIVSSVEADASARSIYIQTLYQNQPLDIAFYKKDLSYAVSQTKDETIYVDQYLYQKDSTDYYWTYASRIGKKIPKTLRLSILEKDSLRTTPRQAMEFLSAAQLDIQPRLLENKRIDPKEQKKIGNEKQYLDRVDTQQENPFEHSKPELLLLDKAVVKDKKGPNCQKQQ